MTEKKLRQLLKKMTPAEKIGQLVQLDGACFQETAMAVGPRAALGISDKTVERCGSVLNVSGAARVRRIQTEYLSKSRLKIPLLFMADVVYGFRTVYPIPLALGCAWDPALAREDNRLTAQEARAGGIHVTFAPMVDLVRDARWGRCMESTGEDPELNSRYAAAMVKGFQDGMAKGRGIAACVKHFAAYGAVEAGRDYNTVDMSERRLRGEYLPSYRAAVDAGARMVMTSFNTVDGVPSTGNRWLMKDILRKEWGFDGVVITDYAAIRELETHGVAASDAEAAALAMDAGVDIDMMTSCYANQLAPLCKGGRLNEKKIDAACLRVLTLKNDLGLFEDPFRGCTEEAEQQETCTPAMRTQACRAAEESMVLLQSKNDVLPIKKGKKIALIGPYAENRDMLGAWAVHGDRTLCATLREAMEKTFGADFAGWTRGCDLVEDTAGFGALGDSPKDQPKPLTQKQRTKELANAKALAEQSDVVVLALGEHPLQSGEAGSRTQLRLPECQQKLLEALSACGKPIVAVLFGGRPLVLTDVLEKTDAVLEAWFPGTEGAHALCALLTGAANPSGHLTMSFPYTEGQEPLYLRHLNTGRPADENAEPQRFTSRYLDSPNRPLFPFGYGLSYHKAEYGTLKLSAKKLHPGEELTATLAVKNTSRFSGTEVVQLYLRDVVASVARPVLELKDFRRVTLEPCEAHTVKFTITEPMLRFYTRSMKFASEPGKFEVFAGPDPNHLSKAEFTLETE
jgi:beta-glucosidase